MVANVQEKEALREALSRERKEHELLAGRVQQQELFHSRQMHEEAERHGQQLDELQQRILQLQEVHNSLLRSFFSGLQEACSFIMPCVIFVHNCSILQYPYKMDDGNVKPPHER